jgi:hypothetical protein
MNSGQAQADIILTIVNAGTPSGNNFLYTYDVMLTPGSVLHPAGGGVNTGVSPSNNYFTLYDIPGLINGSITYGGPLAAAGNSTFSAQGTGITPVTETPKPPDNPNTLNITTYWTGPDIVAPIALDLGTLSFLSVVPVTGGGEIHAFTAATQKFEMFPVLVANNTGQVPGPGGPLGSEPGTLILLAVGLPIVGGLCYWRAASPGPSSCQS